MIRTLVIGLSLALAVPAIAAKPVRHADAAVETSPSPLAKVLWWWNVSRLLGARGARTPLRLPEPSAADVRIASRIEPQVQALLAGVGTARNDVRLAAARATPAAFERGGPQGPAERQASAAAAGMIGTLSLPRDLPAPAMLAAGPKTEAPVLALTQTPRTGASSGLLYAAAALAHGRLETAGKSWKLGLSISHDLDVFKVRLGYIFPAD